MRTITKLFLVGLLAVGGTMAQTTPSSIQANGSATIDVVPDQATLSVGVITQGATAQAAAELNSSSATAMINALKAVLGSNGTIKTIGYSISPRYNNTQPATIVGYQVSNTVQVTVNNINLVGPLIDAANQAGANNINGPSFGLQNPEPSMQQALTAATQQAVAHARAIAAGFAGRLGAMISAQEGGTVIPYAGSGLAAASATPIVTGTVGVTATVTVTMAFVQ